MQKPLFYFSAFALLLGLTAVYSNHFNNSFHFDDSHAVVNNIYIQDIKNIPLFFKDGTTFSSLPPNQSYRPLVTATLAIDYFLGKGLDPFYFHLSTFILFIVQGLLMFLVFKKIFSISSAGANIYFVALLAVAWYLLHPANAETINYIIARGDSLSTLFVLLAFVMYLYSPFCKKYFLYLLPVCIGALAKIPAIMFAPLLFVYILLFENEIPLGELFNTGNFKKLISTIVASLPSFVFCGILYVFVQVMEPDTWTSGGSSRYLYLISQPFVIFHYFRTFFLPLWLSADTDWATFDSLFNLQALFGMVFLAALLFVAFFTSKEPKLRPISFGIFWFLIALIPSSSIIPLSEVMNDHRIFFPYVGLVISVVWALYLLFLVLQKKFSSQNLLIPATLFCLLGLSAYGYGTHERNKVWQTDESLWLDVTLKSPKNARGLMNYGLVLMGRGDYKGAESYFLPALKLWPLYSHLHINMGILKNATGQPEEAEKYFKNAVAYRPDLPDCYFYYADFLHKHKRDAEAITMLEKTLALSKAHITARTLLMNICFDLSDFSKLTQVANETLDIIPGNTLALYYLEATKGKKSKLDVVNDQAKNNPTAEGFLNLSLEYYNAGKYEDCIHACEEAIKLKPDYDLAYNNMCSAYNMLGNWDKAIAAGQKAVELNPNNQLAKNNLLYSKQKKEGKP